MDELAKRLNDLYELYDPYGYGDLFGGVDEVIVHKAFLDALNGDELEDTKEWLMDVISNPDAKASEFNEAQAILQAIA